MKHTSILLSLFVLFSVSCKPVEERLKVRPFALQDVTLNEGMFHTAMQQDIKWLESFEPDRFLSGFRSEAGLVPKAPKYGGWESGGVAGQSFGHYLSACARGYAATGDKVLKERIDYSLKELDTCQQAMGNGLIAGFPRAKELFEEVKRGEITTKGFDLNGGWVPMYTMHKLFAGLIDVYEITGEKKAYDLLLKLSNWALDTFAPLTDAQLQTIMTAEYGGFNESLAEVYALTGDRRYLELSMRFNHRAVMDPLAKGIDELAGKHANTQIPKMIGAIRQYELSGDSTCFHIANNFWNIVTGYHTYVIGGNSEAEHFGVPGQTYDRITDKTCETCNSYNMLKLTKHLFELHPDARKADYYERTLYNHIFASQNPQTGMVCYMSPLAAGSRKEFSTPFESFWCCVGSGMENHVRYGEFIYHTDANDNLYANLFIPSTLHWKARNTSVELQTSFPQSDLLSYSFSMKRSQTFTFFLRYPQWATNGFKLFVTDRSGKKEEIEIAGALCGSYLPVYRTWRDGDVLTYRLPMTVTSEEARGDSTLRAYLYGPVVLASEISGKETITPVVVSDRWMHAGEMLQQTSTPIQFVLQTAQPEPVILRPYYAQVEKKTQVYFNHYSEQQWNARKEFILKQQDMEKWMKEQTIDSFQPGEMQPERDHTFDGIKTEAGELQGRKYRNAKEDGWFGFEMKVLPDQPVDLICSYWGNLGDIYKFSVEVEGKSIATVIIHWWGSSFVDKTYRIPYELTKGKEKITVKFVPMDLKCIAGPLFGCKTMKR